ATGAGFGVAEAWPERPPAGGEAGKRPAGRGLRAVADDALRGLIAARERAERRAGRGQLLEEHQRVHDPALPAAEAPGPGHGQPSLISQRPQELPRMRSRSIARVHAVDGEALERMRAQETPHFFRERVFLRAQLEVHWRSALRSASQRRAEVSGMSRCVTPRCPSASTAALTTAGGMPMQPASPTPLAPSGLRGEGVQVFSISTCGTSSARGIAYSIRVPVTSWPSPS